MENVTNILLKYPILIVGCWRSGTSMLRSVLRMHPDLCGIPNETHYIRAILDEFGYEIDNPDTAVAILTTHGKFPKEVISVAEMRAEFHRTEPMTTSEFLQRTYAIVMRKNPGQRLLIKHPQAALFLDEMLQLFPNLKILGMVRDPRAMLASQLSRWPNTTMSHGVGFWRAALHEADAHCVFGENYFQVSYERLVVEPEPLLKEICHFLAIPYNANLLSFKQPIDYEGGVVGFDASRMNKWQSLLSAEQIHFVQKKCATEMNRLHYPLVEVDYSTVNYQKEVMQDSVRTVIGPGVLRLTDQYREWARMNLWLRRTGRRVLPW